MSPRARNPKYVEELAERLRQNLAAGASLDDVLLALADACARRTVDVSPAPTPDSAAMLATYTITAQRLRDLAIATRRSHKQALRAAKART